MAKRTEANVQPPPGDDYPRCPICGWWDRKLRIVGKAVTPEERLALHMWGRHDHPLPSAWFDPPKKDGDD